MSKESPVPAGRLKRLGVFSSLALNVAGNVAKHGLKELSQARIPDLKSLALTPKNATVIAEKLAHMRGAAMKMGQLISMDAGELMPAELSNILAVLQQQAKYMPASQVQSQLQAAFDADWLDRFLYFEMRPFAAASIGQVHRAYSLDGQKLAVKIQYPGVAEAIDSDVDNMATLVRMLSLHPPAVDMQQILDVAKQQLKDEADYQKEAAYLRQYKTHLQQNGQYLTPDIVEQLTSEQVLTMTYLEGKPLTELTHLPQQQRNEIFSDLLSLFLREVFEFRLLQSDPNMANYRYQEDEKKLVLLDFGATRHVEAQLSEQYIEVIASEIAGDRAAAFHTLTEMGFLHPQASKEALEVIAGLLDIIRTPLVDEVFDFENTRLLSDANALALALNKHRDAFGNPPPEAMFIHRKALGLLFIAKRLGARINVREHVKNILKV